MPIPGDSVNDMGNLLCAQILLVHKNPEQVNAFVQQLAIDCRADVYIHIDAKCSDAMVRAIASGPRVSVLKERVSVSWGDHNMIDATLLLLRAVRASGKNYDFVCLNSGQDLLVRAGLAAHLARNRGMIFMQAKRCESHDPHNFYWRIRWPRITRNRYEWALHPYRLLRAAMGVLYMRGLNLRPNPRNLPENWFFYHGAQWFCLSGEAAEYILDYLDRNPAFEAVFKDSLVPDMSFFQTLIMNSPLANQVTGAHLTYLNFGETYRDKNHAVVLTMKDVPAIENSGGFFARKFDQTVDADVIHHFCRMSNALPKATATREPLRGSMSGGAVVETPEQLIPSRDEIGIMEKQSANATA